MLSVEADDTLLIFSIFFVLKCDDTSNWFYRPDVTIEAAVKSAIKWRKPLILMLAALAQVVAVEAQQTPATFSLVAIPDNAGNDGSSEAKAFRGSGIELFLDIQDDTPSAYVWGGFEAVGIGGNGTFCPGNFRFFSTENRLFFLKHPRVESGTVVIQVTGIVQEAGFEIKIVEGRFFIARHVLGCSPDGTGAGPPAITFFNASSTVPSGGIISLSARAIDNDPSLTFSFFRSDSSLEKGTSIGTLTATGCTSTCTANLDALAPLFPSTPTFTVEVLDSDGNIDSRSLSVRIGQRECVPGVSVSRTCGSTEIAVNVGCADPVTGGQSIELNGSVSGALGGAVVPPSGHWSIFDSGGLSGLRIRDPFSTRTILHTPVVAVDRQVTLRLRGTLESCVAEDTLTVTLLATQQVPTLSIWGVTLLVSALICAGFLRLRLGRYDIRPV